MSNIDKLVSLVVEGSTWTSKGGRDYTVAFVTNSEAPESVIDKYGIQVVFLNENQEVYSLPIVRFVRSYKYKGVNETFAEYIHQVYECSNGNLDETGLASYKNAIKFINDYEEESNNSVEGGENADEAPAEEHIENVEQVEPESDEHSYPYARFYTDAEEEEGYIEFLTKSFAGYRNANDLHSFVFNIESRDDLNTVESSFRDNSVTACFLETSIGTIVLSWDIADMLSVSYETLNGNEYAVVTVRATSANAECNEPESESGSEPEPEYGPNPNMDILELAKLAENAIKQACNENASTESASDDDVTDVEEVTDVEKVTDDSGEPSNAHVASSEAPRKILTVKAGPRKDEISNPVLTKEIADQIVTNVVTE